MKLLHIDTSITGGVSASRQLSAAIVAEYRRSFPEMELIRRDFDTDPIPHLDSRLLPLVRPDVTAGASSAIGYDNGAGALDEFLAADIVVIGAPMYNFGVPSQLKAWLDRIVIAGRTFRYTENGPVGLAAGKKVVIASSRGGLYAPGMPFQAYDFQETYLRAVFGFLGITDIEIVRAEGLAMGPDTRDKAIRNALASVSAAVAPTLDEQAA